MAEAFLAGLIGFFLCNEPNPVILTLEILAFSISLVLQLTPIKRDETC